MPGGIIKEIHSGEEILIVDFSGCKESQMIELLIELRNMVISDKKPISALAIFDDKNFFTSKFMQALRKEKRVEATPFLKKQALIGLSESKKIILKGYNLFFNRDIRAFDSKESAMLYLTSD